MTNATQMLRDDHEIILRMLEATEKVAESLEAGKAPAPQVVNNIIEFLRLYADRYHHGKEEDLLFPLLGQKGLPMDGGPVGVMLIEHEQGRGFIREMAAAAADYEKGNEQAGRRWAEAANNYIALLRDHISKENNILFMMAERLLSPAEQQQLFAKFQEVPAAKLQPGDHQRLLGLVDVVCAEAAATAAR